MMRAILLVSFGTTNREQLEKNLDGLTAVVKEAFSTALVVHAFSSEVVRDRLLAYHDLVVPNVGEAMEAILSAGCEEVVVQPLHLLAGKEYHKVLEQLTPYKERIPIKVGGPLLTAATLQHLADSMWEGCTSLAGQLSLWIGHGTDHTAHAIYGQLDWCLQSASQGKSMLVTLEDVAHAPLVAQRMKEQGLQGIHIQAFMLVAGNHLLKDILGEEASSWCSTFKQLGVTTTVSDAGIGQTRWLRQLLLERMKTLVGRD